MHLSKKQNIFSIYFYFVNLDSLLNIFKKADDPYSWRIFELADSEGLG